MPDLFLSIATAALREAVAEQITAFKLGDVRFVGGPQEGLSQGRLLVIVEDAAENVEAFVRFAEKAAEKPVLLVLGGGEQPEAVTETFPLPLRLGHLISRVRYYLETEPLLRESVVTFGPFRLEPRKRCVARANEAELLRLTEKETALLVFLAQHNGPATRQEILAEVWGYDDRIDTHTLETHIYQLRRKLDRDGESWLVNDAGAYRLAGCEG